MSDDWSKVTSKKGKKKTKKISEDTRKKQLADAGLLSSPLDNKPTMYEKFDEEMARKEKAASGRRAADTDTDTDDDTTAARPTSKPKKVPPPTRMSPLHTLMAWCHLGFNVDNVSSPRAKRARSLGRLFKGR